MSLHIESDRITDVLLADGWHRVVGASFVVDAYEYVEGDELVHGDGTGFEFTDDHGHAVAGPMTAVLAVRSGRVDQ
jgi:hypothetical protein